MKNKPVATRREPTRYSTWWPKVTEPAPSFVYSGEDGENENPPVLFK